MPDPKPHSCHPLSVAGVLRATCATHWWTPMSNTTRHLTVVSR